MPDETLTRPVPIAVTDVTEFFRDSVDAAIASNQVAVDQHTAHYLVSLLAFFVRSEALFDQACDGPRLRPLALMLAQAVEAESPDVRNAALQRLGDVALFVAGFLADGVRHSSVGLDYYVRMGGGAYHVLARELPATTRGRTFAPVFAELGEKFQDIVDVLSDVRHAAASPSDRDVLHLYELWLTTGSRRAARLLRGLGIFPLEQPGAARAH